MKIAIMQPYFMPYIGYWQLIASVDEFILFDDVNYINKGYINRNNYLSSGKSKLFSIQLKGASQNKKIGEIEVARTPTKLLKSIQQEYKKSPYFDNVYSIISKVLENCDGMKISELNYNLIVGVFDYLGMKKKVSFASELQISDGFKSQDRILEICRVKNATEYINAIGGYDLYSSSDFKAKNIELRFIKAKPIIYKQFNDEFVPNLSIMDVLFFNAKEDVVNMLTKYELIEKG